MPFYIAESDLNGAIMSGTISQLSPGPAWVDYPEKFTNSIIYSRDGNPVVQSPLKDGRPRTWIWKRYRSSVPKYDALYNKLLNYQHKLRETSFPPKSPWVWVKDTETGNLTFRQWDGTKWIEVETWVRVKVTMVTQNIAQQGGHAVYEDTLFTFVIDDPAWSLF